MNSHGKILMVIAFLWSLSSCQWGIHGSPEDGGPDRDAVDLIDGDLDIDVDVDGRDPVSDPDITDPDALDPDAGDPVGPEPDAQEPDLEEEDVPEEDLREEDIGEEDIGEEDLADLPAEDMAEEDAEEEEAGTECGNGIVDSDEECDDASGFCIDCVLTAPSGWIECTDSSGNKAFLLLEDWPGRHRWDEFRDHCQGIVEGFSPEDYAYYGLAVFSDDDIWNCIESSLDRGTSYYVGLHKNSDDEWYWQAYDGSGWIDLSSWDDGHAGLGGSFDDDGGTGPVDCGRIVRSGGSWIFSDHGCNSSTDWWGICMIQF